MSSNKKVKVWKDDAQEWRWTYWASSDKVATSGEGHKSRRSLFPAAFTRTPFNIARTPTVLVALVVASAVEEVDGLLVVLAIGLTRVGPLLDVVHAAEPTPRLARRARGDRAGAARRRGRRWCASRTSSAPGRLGWSCHPKSRDWTPDNDVPPLRMMPWHQMHGATQ